MLTDGPLLNIISTFKLLDLHTVPIIKKKICCIRNQDHHYAGGQLKGRFYIHSVLQVVQRFWFNKSYYLIYYTI